mgnify:CR=1 FL=1
MKYDVIIIGAGPGGIFSAYELSKTVPTMKIAIFEEGKELEKELRSIIKEKEDAIRNQEFEKASQLRDDEADMKDRRAARL